MIFSYVYIQAGTLNLYPIYFLLILILYVLELRIERTQSSFDSYLRISFHFDQFMLFLLPGPCQPFKASQTELCSEFQTFLLDDDNDHTCNSHRASCNYVNNTRGLLSRKDYLWGYCYCDELCKLVGDCCVDYDEW